MNTNQCLLLVILATLAKLSSGAEQQSCNQTEVEQHLLKLLIFGHPTMRFPAKAKHVKPFCRDILQTFPKVETYRKRCIKDEVLRNLISIITYAYKATIKRVCSRPTSPRTQAIVAGGECLNRNSKPIMKCLVTMGDTFAGIKEAQDRLKMPHICCQYAQLFDCWLEVMKRDKCEKHLEVLKDQARSVMGNFVDASCGEYHHETDKCTQLGPPPKAKNRTGNYMDELVAIFHTINP